MGVVDGGTYCKCKANQLQPQIVKGLQNDFSSFNLFKRRTILCLTSNHTITISPSPHQHHHITITITISPSPHQHQHHQHHLHITILGLAAPNHISLSPQIIFITIYWYFPTLMMAGDYFCFVMTPS